MTTLQERLDKLDELLNEYQTLHGLPLQCPKEIEIRGKELLEMVPTQFKSLNREDCAEAALTLSQFGFYIQQTINVETARLHWCEENVRRIIAPLLPQQTAYAYKERESTAMLGDDAAIKLDSLRVQVSFRIARMAYLASKIEGVRQGFIELSQAKPRSGI